MLNFWFIKYKNIIFLEKDHIFTKQNVLERINIDKQVRHVIKRTRLEKQAASIFSKVEERRHSAEEHGLHTENQVQSLALHSPPKHCQLQPQSTK